VPFLLASHGGFLHLNICFGADNLFDRVAGNKVPMLASVGRTVLQDVLFPHHERDIHNTTPTPPPPHHTAKLDNVNIGVKPYREVGIKWEWGLHIVFGGGRGREI
jgi:hypothetical protein